MTTNRQATPASVGRRARRYHRRRMRVPHLSPIAYRRITIVAAVLLAIIIVTGAAVRLTSSGLGCPVGISCPKSQLQAHGASSEHATIEHVNRLFTGLVSVAVI